ncbi:type II toxin-antitoxin system RelE family toxin [Halovivax gelatinilyticus]|uniref:type II toxin-antitoxin system RelE family toxin n=1 Tax=Halovivax gelatinilyticus TaxID=2961597 RepID=UPI0031B8091B
MVDVFFTDRGRNRLEELEPDTQERVTKKLRDVRDWPDHYLKRLTGRDDYVLRVGDYRVLIEWKKRDDELYVKSVGHRRNFYDREP